MYDFAYMVSVYDLIENPDFENLCRILHLTLQSSWLEAEYDNIKRGQGDAFLFQSQEGCLLLDLFQEPTDQNEMIFVGIRCKEMLRDKIQNLVKTIYNMAPIKSLKISEGENILDSHISPQCYPMERLTITQIDGKEVYKYFQKLRVFH